jgi:hypothetical protein
MIFIDFRAAHLFCYRTGNVSAQPLWRARGASICPVAAAPALAGWALSHHGIFLPDALNLSETLAGIID